MATATDTTTKARRGAQPGPALREARRKADEERRRADELQRQLDEMRRRGPDVTPTTPTPPPTEPTADTSASDDPLDEPPPPRPPDPERVDSTSGDPSGEASESAASDDEPTKTATVGPATAEHLVRMILGQFGAVYSWAALAWIERGARRKALAAGVDPRFAEQLAVQFVQGIGKRVREASELTPAETDELVTQIKPLVAELLEDLTPEAALGLTVLTICAAKAMAISRIVHEGEVEAGPPAIDVTPTKDAT